VADDLTRWPDTTATEPPSGAPSASAAWLLGRHPHLAGLVVQVPDMVSRDAEGRLSLDLTMLAVVVTTYDHHRASWAAYELQEPAPSRDADQAYAAWAASGPAAPPSVRVIGGLAAEELSALRLLGTFSPFQMLFGVEEARHLRGPLLADWCRAIQLV